jgi:RNA polymerase sigma-70 factor (ECF subfamily)
MVVCGKNSEPEDKTAVFLGLLSEHERRFSLYVTGLVGSPQDAQDILQEGKLLMWRNFDAFEIGTNFSAWGRKILFHRILSYRRQSKKFAYTLLNEETLRLLDEEADSAEREQRWQARERALDDCVVSLKPAHREILEMRYRDEVSIEKIARQSGRTEGAVYRLLSRLRAALHECIESRIMGSV